MILKRSFLILAYTGLCWTFAHSTADAQGLQQQSPQINAQSQDGANTDGWQTQSYPEQNAQTENNSVPVTTVKKPNDTAAPLIDVQTAKELIDKSIETQKPKPKAKPKPKKPVNAEYARANRTSVSIVSSTIDNSALVMANDLARLLDDEKKLRVVPIVGKGTAQSLKDLYYLKGVDMGIVQVDVLRHYKKNKKLPDPARFIRYISTLGTQEVHVIARRQIKTLKELQGRNVNVGPIGGGSAITAQAVFKAHKIEINSVHLENRSAIQRMRNGEIDAIFLVGGKPYSSLLSTLAATQDFHLLDVNFNKELEKYYQPTVMIHEDYPFLIHKDRVVSSVAVDMVMAMYYWPKGTVRYNKVARFVDAFFSKLNKLQTPLYHRKWREVKPRHSLRGWKRFRAATEWLKTNKKSVKRTY